MSGTAPSERPGTFRSIVAAARSWRTLSVTLMSFSSGLPLGLVWIAIPDWLRSQGVDIKTVGFITLSQAPWSFKFVWSPLMDRWSPPFLGRRRGWALVAQIGLFLTTLSLAGVGNHPDVPWIVGALALAQGFAAATQDIAVDAYAVDALRPEEQGLAVGARIALYRAAMYIAGGLSISLAGRFSWPAVLVGLAFLYVPLAVATAAAPEPTGSPRPPKTLGAAVWQPFLGFLSRPRALEILSFVVLYKLADNLGAALLRPFLVDMGYSADDRGFALATIGLTATLVGTFAGGILSTLLGLGHSLWIFGALQVLSNVGYILIAAKGTPDRPLMYAAMAFESLTQGLGTGAFSVLLLRLTEKRFSATQYALFSSLFGLPRILAGPIAGVTVDSFGWTTFFWATMAAGLPGLVFLQRFAPIGVREPRFETPVAPAGPRRPLSSGRLVGAGALAGILALVGGGLSVALLGALAAMRGKEPKPFAPGEQLARLVAPAGISDWINVGGLVIFAGAVGLFSAAVFAARRGAGLVAEDAPAHSDAPPAPMD